MAKYGVFIEGQFKGYFEKENGNFTNRYLGVVTGTYENKFEDQQENIKEINVSEKQALEHAKNWEAIIGKPVRVKVGQSVRSGVSARTGKAYAFLNTYLDGESNIELINHK